MFGVFKKLFWRPASPPPTAAPMPVKPPLASLPLPKPTASTPAPVSVAKQVNGMIELPLNEILTKLPNDLAPQVLSPPGVMFSLSTGVAVEQLRTGAVRIPFSQLRQGSPPGTFAPNGGHDDSLIDLPLPLILAAIGPAGLTRRSDQKRTVVPEDVTGVFGSKNIKFSPSPEKAPAPASTLEQPRETPASMPGPIPPPVTPKVTPTAAQTPVAPKATTSLAQTTVAPKPPATLPFVSARPAAPPPAAPAPSVPTVVVTVEAVSAAWPEAVRNEIQGSNLAIALISIPVSRLEQGMKAGRVLFTWAELRGWLNSPVPPSAHGETPLEIPLKVIAPLFLANQSAKVPRKTVNIGENLPDLFAGVVRPAAATPAPEVEPPPPPPAPQVLAETKTPAPKTDWTPQEIAQRVLSLPGVAGALLASQEGLRVAGQMPAPLNAETMAAFLPRIFTQSGHCAGEMQLGTLRVLRLSAGTAPSLICKAGKLYLAVLGQPGQNLPEAALEQLTLAWTQNN